MNPFPKADLPSYAGFLPHVGVDAHGPIALLADNAEGVPDTMGIAWRLSPVEAEARTDADVGAFAGRLDAMLQSLPDGAVAQFLLRSSRDASAKLDTWQQAGRESDPILDELGRSRRAALERLSIVTRASSFQLRKIETLFTLVRPGTWPTGGASVADALREAAGAGDPVSHDVADRYAADRKGFLEVAQTLESLLAQAGVGFARLDGDALARELYLRLNPLRSRTMGVPAALHGEPIRERVAQSALAVDLDEGVVTLDDVFHAVVSVTRLPGSTHAGMLMRSLGTTLLDVVPDVELVLNIHVGDQEEIRSSFGARRRLATDQSKDAHQSPSLQPQLDELVAIERELACGARVASLRLHAIVRGASADEARDRARAIQAALQGAGFRAHIEDALAGTIFLQCLPLSYRPDSDRAMRRGRKILTANLAHLAPVYGSFGGASKPTQILLNRRGEPVHLSFFDGTAVPHAIVTGKSGAGKSVLANDLILNARRSGARVFVLDRGGSYRKLAQMLGGASVTFEGKTPARLNPCGTPGAEGGCPEETNSFLRDWLTEMATHGKADLPIRDQSLLSMAVRKAFETVRSREVLLSDIHAALVEMAKEHPASKDLAVCLSDYVKGGPYARFFDGMNQIDFTNPFVALDLADAALEDAVTSVLVMAVMHRVAEACRAWPNDEKYLIVDEAWTLLKSPATARFIENVSRTARKARLSLVILSQQITDLDGKTGQAILAQASTKVCLHQDADAIRQAVRLLGLNDREAALYASLKTVPGAYSELFVKTPSSAGVARLAMDPLGYWITTSDPLDRKVLDEFVAGAERRGLQGREALRHALMEASLRHPKGASSKA